VVQEPSHSFYRIKLKRFCHEILKRVQEEQTLRIGWRVSVGTLYEVAFTGCTRQTTKLIIIEEPEQQRREQQKVLAISCALAALGKYWPLHWLRNISSRFKLIPRGLSASLDGCLAGALACVMFALEQFSSVCTNKTDRCKYDRR